MTAHRGNQSAYAPPGERSWAQREADERQALQQLTEVAQAAGRREVLDALGIEHRGWEREVYRAYGSTLPSGAPSDSSAPPPRT